MNKHVADLCCGRMTSPVEGTVHVRMTSCKTRHDVHMLFAGIVSLEPIAVIMVILVMKLFCVQWSLS